MEFSENRSVICERNYNVLTLQSNMWNGWDPKWAY